MSMRIPALNPELIQNAVSVLEDGGLVVYPTETCYGLGVDATNQDAVDRLFTYKTRREGKPFSVAVDSMNMAQEYVEINNTARNLYENYLPGPLTVVSKGKGKVAKGIESEYGTLGIRIPNHPIALSIVKQFGKPITATSANVSYLPKPYSIDQLLRDIPEKHSNLVDLYIDAGELPHNETSTVVDTTLNDLTIIRQGQIAFSEKTGKTSFSVITQSPEETSQFASMVTLKYIDHLQKGPIVFALGGELGSGKTQFAKGIAAKLGITRTVKSPTFTLITPYSFIRDGKTGVFAHMDTWRLNDEKEFVQVGIDQYLHRPNIVAIEWADKFIGAIEKLAQDKVILFLKVHMKHVDDNKRSIEIEEYNGS